MAKVGELDFGSFELDNNLDFGDFGDFEDSKPKKSSKRETVLEVGKAVGEGVKDTLTDPAKIRDAIKSTLPGGFKAAWDVVDETASTVSTMYDETVKELKPGLSTITKKLDNFVPEESTRLKKVTKKLHDFFKVEADNSSSSNQNIEDQGVENMLKGVFATQMEQQEAIRNKEDKETLLRDRIEDNRHRSQVQLFSRMDDNLQRIGEYTTGPNMAFQKKSLELSFRSYFTLAEILKHSKESAAKDREVLTNIMKNTGLPEFVKIKESERFRQIAKDRLWSGAYNRMFGEGSRIKTGLDKLKVKGKEFLEGAKQGVEGGLMLTDSMEQIKEMNDQMAEMTGKKTSMTEHVGKFAGGFLGDHTLGKVAGVAKDRIANNETAQIWDQKLSRWVDNPDELINKVQNSDRIKNSDLDDGPMAWAYKATSALLDMFKDEKTLIKGETGSGIDNMIDPTYSDEHSRRAQVDVIPGYLARILREVTVLRTNDDSQGLVVFDHNTGKFKSQSQLTDDIKESLRKRFKDSSLGAAKTVVADQFTGADVSPEDKKDLADAITKLSSERGVTFSKEGLQDTKSYANLSDKQRQLLNKHVFGKMDEEGVEGEKYKTLFTKSVGMIRKSLPDVEKEIRERIAAGQRDELEAAGIITVSEDGKTWTLNEDKYYEMAGETGLTTSDINAKTNISKVSPKGLLAKIKKIGIFNWSYKPGEGPQGHEFQGPMAQDVNKELGEEAAPGGKKIDLVSMNGANMAAIQELSKEVDGLKSGTGTENEGTTFLKQISDNTSKLVELVSGAFSRKGEGGQAYTPMPTQGFAGPSSGVQGVDDLTGFIQTGIALMTKGLTKGVKGVWDQGTKAGKAVGGLVSDNKDKIKDASKFLLDSVTNLVGKGLNFGSEVLFNYAPKGIAKVKDFMKTLNQKFKELVNGAQDLYQEGMNSPVIQASLMRAGYYKDQATGQVIKTVDDLRNLKGHVVNSMGEVIIKAEDVARGLYNSKGEKIRSTAMTLGKAVVGAAIWTGKKLYQSGKDLLNKGRDALSHIPGLGDLKASASNAMTRLGDKIKGMDIGFGTQRIYDVLTQIRDLVSIGKPKKLVASILARKSGKPGDPPEKGGKNWLEKLNKEDSTGKNESSGSSIEGGGEGSEGGLNPDGSPAEPSTTNSTGVGGVISKTLGRVKGYFDNRKAQQEAQKEHDDNFVGPQQPQTQTEAGPSIMDRIRGVGKKLKERIKPTRAKDTPDFVGPQQPQTQTEAGPSIMDRIRGMGKKVKERIRPTRAKDSPDFVGPKRPMLGGKGAFLKKGLMAGKGLFGKAAGALGGLASGAMGMLGGGGDQESTTPTQDTQPKSIGDRFKSMASDGRQKVRDMIARKGAKFNDKDGDGGRDGNAVEQLKKQEEDKQLRLERNKASAEAAAERANEGIKYKSSENVIDTIAKKAMGLFDMLKGGAGGLLETAASFLSMKNLKGLAGGIWKAVKNPIGALRSVGTGIKSVATLARGAGLVSKLSTVATVARTALTVGGVAMGGVGGTVMAAGSLALSAIGTALASPVVLGGLAVAAVGVAGYYGYKYFTRDRLNAWETLRAMQYGLPGNPDDKKYNHMVMNLERYFLEGRIGYSDGKAYILDKKVDHKEICKIMDVDPGDDDHVQKFAGWLSKRFKPFFLNSVSALFSVDRKASLAEIEKLSDENKKKVLPLLQFLEGPYSETETPFKDIQEPLTDVNIIKAQVAVIEKQLGTEKIKGNDPNAEIKKKMEDLRKGKSEEKAEEKKELKTKLENEAKNSPLFKKPDPVPETTSNLAGVDKALSSQTAGATPFANSMNATGMTKTEQGTEKVGNSLATSSPRSSSFDPSTVKKVPFSESIEKIKEIIAEAGKKVGVDPRIMQIMAAIESGFKPFAKAATSSATGLFQFIKSTWQAQLRKSGSKHGLSPDASPLDPVANSIMGAEFLKENSNIIKKVKPDPNVTDLYIAHFLGPGGAQKFLRSPPDAVGESLFPAPAKANPTIFRADKGRGQPLTVGQIYQNFENKLKKLAASYGIEFPTTGTSMATGNPPTPAAEGPKPPTPLEKVGTTAPTAPTAPAATDAAKPVTTTPTQGALPSEGVATPPSSTPPATEAAKKETPATPMDKIPGIEKPQPAPEVAYNEPPKPAKKYPWVMDQRPDDLAVGRGSDASKSGEANFKAMDGISATMESQLTVSREVRDVLKERVAPTLERMLEVLSKGITPQEAPSTKGQPSLKAPPARVVPNTPSALDLRRMA